ncbi:hypothetical protein GCM10009763_03610 [Dermacoccus profundi]|uniref:Uncharacterized protein n=1 Tax=Dermacoccus profundi TaxID=322602 RepID=A0ABN2CI12_9MICO
MAGEPLVDTPEGYRREVPRVEADMQLQARVCGAANAPWARLPGAATDAYGASRSCAGEEWGDVDQVVVVLARHMLTAACHSARGIHAPHRRSLTDPGQLRWSRRRSIKVAGHTKDRPQKDGLGPPLSAVASD